MSNPLRIVRLPAALVGASLAILGIAAQPALAGDKVVVRDVVLTHNVAERMPTDSVDGFSADTDVGFAFVRISNSGDPTQVKVVWSRNGVEQGAVPLNVGTSSGWRTWSSTNLQPGNWRVQVVDANGGVLSQKDFTVGPRAVASQPQRDNVSHHSQDNVSTAHQPQSSQVPSDQVPSDQVADPNE
jgi:hypothetical protein